MILIALMVKLTSKGRALFWSDRIGKVIAVFKMPQFWTMRQRTPAIATHLLNPELTTPLMGDPISLKSLTSDNTGVTRNLRVICSGRK
jgi:O-antigen biosynthesis protein WbqP